jgi:hypothetical protein
MKGFEQVAVEATNTSRRMDVMEGQVNRFSGALETFLGRIHIDERLRLVPDSRWIGDAPSLAPSLALFPVTRSASPSTSLQLPMDEDDDALGVTPPSVQDTRTTPSDVNPDIRMAEVAERTPLAGPEPTALASAATDPALTVHVTPATPHGSQHLAGPPPTLPGPIPTLPTPSTCLPPIAEAVPPPRHRSRTPARSLLDVPVGATTRARSRSKTPN